MKFKEKQNHEENKIKKEISNLQTENRVQRLKAQKFNDRKKKTKLASRTSSTSNSFDFSKNVPAPNILLQEAIINIFNFNVSV